MEKDPEKTGGFLSPILTVSDLRMSSSTKAWIREGKCTFTIDVRFLSAVPSLAYFAHLYIWYQHMKRLGAEGNPEDWDSDSHSLTIANQVFLETTGWGRAFSTTTKEWLDTVPSSVSVSMPPLSPRSRFNDCAIPLQFSRRDLDSTARFRRIISPSGPRQLSSCSKSSLMIAPARTCSSPFTKRRRRDTSSPRRRCSSRLARTLTRVRRC